MKRIALILALIFLSIFLYGCGGRDISSVDKALLGHWKVIDGNEAFIGSEYYISENTFISISNGTEEKYNYDVLRKNNDEGTITIQLSKADNTGFDHEITFKNNDKTKLESLIPGSSFKWSDNTTEKDRELFNDFIDYLKFDITTTWEYLDDKQEPL